MIVPRRDVKGEPVGVVTMMCPRTGDFVSTGVELDAERFKAYPPTVSRMRCPSCGSEHAWSKGRAWLADAAPLIPGGQLPKQVVDAIQVYGRVDQDLRSLTKAIEGAANSPPMSSKPDSMQEYLARALSRF